MLFVSEKSTPLLSANSALTVIVADPTLLALKVTVPLGSIHILLELEESTDVFEDENVTLPVPPLIFNDTLDPTVTVLLALILREAAFILIIGNKHKKIAKIIIFLNFIFTSYCTIV